MLYVVKLRGVPFRRQLEPYLYSDGVSHAIWRSLEAKGLKPNRSRLPDQLLAQ
jgi:hypothetical protein